MTDDVVEYDVRLRAAGKTYDLVTWWRDQPGRVLVTGNQEMISALVNEYAVTPQDRKRLITFDQLREGRVLRGRGSLEVGVDNLDVFLRRLMPANVLLRRVTATGLWADDTILAMRREMEMADG